MRNSLVIIVLICFSQIHAIPLTKKKEKFVPAEDSKEQCMIKFGLDPDFVDYLIGLHRPQIEINAYIGSKHSCIHACMVKLDQNLNPYDYVVDRVSADTKEEYERLIKLVNKCNEKDSGNGCVLLDCVRRNKELRDFVY